MRAGGPLLKGPILDLGWLAEAACDSNDHADTLDVSSDAVDKRILGASASPLRSPGLSLDFEWCMWCGARSAKPLLGRSSGAQLHHGRTPGHSPMP